MNGNSAPSILSVLSLYGNLRRQGSNAEDAISKLEGLIVQLGLEDRKELDNGIQDWEAKRGKQADAQALNYAEDMFSKTPPPRTSTLTEHLEDVTAPPGASIDMLLQRIQPPIGCFTCGKMNDPKLDYCAFCNASLKATLPRPLSTQDKTWFGPDSRLQLIIKGVSAPIEILVQNTITLGRHTSSSAISDVDLGPYRADALGVSRLHASIKRQGTMLLLSDMRSTNHTFANGHRLNETEAYTLKHGDEIAVGTLSMTVAFLHENVLSRA